MNDVQAAVDAERQRIWDAIRSWEEGGVRLLEDGELVPREGFSHKPLSPFFNELYAIVFAIPDRERIAWDNPDVRASLERGIADAAAGRVGPWSGLAHKKDDDS